MWSIAPLVDAANEMISAGELVEVARLLWTVHHWSHPLIICLQFMEDSKTILPLPAVPFTFVHNYSLSFYSFLYHIPKSSSRGLFVNPEGAGSMCKSEKDECIVCWGILRCPLNVISELERKFPIRKCQLQLLYRSNRFQLVPNLGSFHLVSKTSLTSLAP